MAANREAGGFIGEKWMEMGAYRSKMPWNSAVTWSLAMEDDQCVIQRRPSHSLSSHPRRRLAITRRTSLLNGSDCSTPSPIFWAAARRQQLAKAAE
ncbi:uncharacterized protein TrAtP1_009710 [Trichoderma atroviride]|uniref:uncharacterized protein n=1 Tax=Hypocrea atroviridis TaxID=63577 RepID=UPI0033179B64|nr:hypothetical protein TrAtP1_009710 [Trichoderma atroviride]